MTLWPNVKFNAQFNTGFSCKTLLCLLGPLNPPAGDLGVVESRCASGELLCVLVTTRLSAWPLSCQVLLSHFSAGMAMASQKNARGASVRAIQVLGLGCQARSNSNRAVGGHASRWNVQPSRWHSPSRQGVEEGGHVKQWVTEFVYSKKYPRLTLLLRPKGSMKSEAILTLSSAWTLYVLGSVSLMDMTGAPSDPVTRIHRQCGHNMGICV